MTSSITQDIKQQAPEYLGKLRPGLELSVQITHPRPVRFNSTLLGFSMDDYILVTLPETIRTKYHGTLLFNGNNVVVRFLLEGRSGHCVAFSSTIESCITFPRQILFLNFPHQINTFDIRRYPRVSTCLRGQLRSKCLTDSEFMVGRVRNVSLGGCCFTFNVNDYPVNVKRREVELILGGNEEITFHGAVRNQRLIHGLVHVGIEFHATEVESEERLIEVHIDPQSLRDTD